jgi:GT2 family glycosyltransferase
MAALTARSQHGYQLWIARDEQRAWDRFLAPVDPGDALIVPLVDCRSGSSGLEQTLASMDPADAARAIVVGACSTREPAEGLSSGAMLGQDVWICPIQPGDRLAPGALSAYSRAAAAMPQARLIYVDDDLTDRRDGRIQPHLKPDWNPDLFTHHDFLSYSSIIRVPDGGADFVRSGRSVRALIEEELAKGASPIHVPLVLHHRVHRPHPIIPAKPTSAALEDPPTISVIVPTRNKLSLLRKCLEGLQQTDYQHVETIVIDNGSDEADTLAYLDRLEREGVRVLRLPGPFNYSALNNAAVALCEGELLCFLNNDVEMLDHDWLWILATHAVREDIGAVGPRLLYPDGTVQHAGVVIGVGGGAAHAHRFQPKDAEGYFDRARLPQRVSAVTAACLVLERRKFLAVGGFDEENFPVAFNDVDLCLKLNARGWQSFYEPRSTLIHHESKSRGRDRSRLAKARFAGELAALKTKWRTDELRDPYHHPHLSRYTEQFLLSV